MTASTFHTRTRLRRFAGRCKRTAVVLGAVALVSGCQVNGTQAEEGHVLCRSFATGEERSFHTSEIVGVRAGYFGAATEIYVERGQDRFVISSHDPRKWWCEVTQEAQP